MLWLWFELASDRRRSLGIGPIVGRFAQSLVDIALRRRQRSRNGISEELPLHQHPPRVGEMNGTFAEVNHSVAEIASGWRSDRAQRQLRRHLDPADFALLCSSWHSPTTGRIPEGRWVNRDRASHELTIDGGVLQANTPGWV